MCVPWLWRLARTGRNILASSDRMLSSHITYCSYFILDTESFPKIYCCRRRLYELKQSESVLFYCDVAGSHAAWSHGRRTRDFLRRQAVNTRPGQILEIILLNTDNMRLRHNTHDVTWQQSHDLYWNDIGTGSPGHFAYTGLDFGCVHNE